MTINTVHIFSKPVQYYLGLELSSLIADNDVVLLTGDACYDIRSYKSFSKSLYVLSDCTTARGLPLTNDVTGINDLEWVELIDNAQKSITW
jgi:tRNA 2-thiouridine synthesizing protein B